MIGWIPRGTVGGQLHRWQVMMGQGRTWPMGIVTIPYCQSLCWDRRKLQMNRNGMRTVRWKHHQPLDFEIIDLSKKGFKIKNKLLQVLFIPISAGKYLNLDQ